MHYNHGMKKEREPRKKEKARSRSTKIAKTSEQQSSSKTTKRQRKKAESSAQPLPSSTNRRKTLNPKIRSELAVRIRENDKAITDFKRNAHFVCSCCGKEIGDYWSAVCSKEEDGLLHFECAMSIVRKNETIEADEKLSYIGNGRFAVIKFADPKNPKRFSIRKIINWESEGQHPKWREDISTLYGTIL